MTQVSCGLCGAPLASELSGDVIFAASRPWSTLTIRQSNSDKHKEELCNLCVDKVIQWLNDQRAQ